MNTLQRYKCHNNRNHVCVFHADKCPLFKHGIYPNNRTCENGIIELDWIQTILYKEMLNDFTQLQI